MKKMFITSAFAFVLLPAFAQSIEQTKKDPALSCYNTAGTSARQAQITRSGTPLPQALSGFLAEGFESTAFPPPGWQSVSVQGPLTWKRSTAAKKSGLASAYMEWELQSGEDYLILPKFTVAAGDSIRFELACEYVGYDDTLVVAVSTTDSAITSFVDTILLISDSIGYPNTTNLFQRYKISLSPYIGQDIFITFLNSNTNGDGIFIDDVALGTPFPDDVAAVSLDMKKSIGASLQTVQATAKNMGQNMQPSFLFSVDINGPGGTYSSSAPVTLLAPNASQQVSFTNWTPLFPGTYTVYAYTQLAGDDYTPNDTLVDSIIVYPGFTNYGWKSMPALSAGKFGVGGAFHHTGNFPADTNWIYETGGFDASFTLSSATNAFSSVSGSWNTSIALPLARAQLSGNTINGKIYFMGGYTGGFTPTDQNDIYDIASGIWSTGAPMPVAVGDYATGVYKDSLIYYIGGFNGTTDESSVNIYDTYTNTWTTGTAKPGAASAGLRCGISGNKIVVVGGYSQALSGTISEAALGVINPANPASIAWTALADYPGGTISRHSGGSVYWNALPLIVFNGGSGDGSGVSVVNETWAYDLADNTWKIGPPKLTATNNICGLVGAMNNDSLYMVSLGGYDGAIVTDDHEWLNLGPVPAGSGLIHTNNPSVQVQVAPNPFTDNTVIDLSLLKNSTVEIRIVDIRGRTAALLCHKELGSGHHRFNWKSAGYPQGIYMARITVSDESITRKLVKQ